MAALRSLRIGLGSILYIVIYAVCLAVILSSRL